VSYFTRPNKRNREGYVKTPLRSPPEQSRHFPFSVPPSGCPYHFADFALEPVPLMLNHFSGVMAGLVAAGLDPGAIHVFLAERPQERRGCRDKRGHDGGEVIRCHRNAL
jgi:hypothetical protein